MKHKAHAFTLIELLIAIVILGMLVVMLIGNFNTTLKRGRDAQRKNDLSQIQKALELYYEDNKMYPVFADNNIFGKKLCTSDAIIATGDCPAGDVTYMVRVPKDQNTTYVYRYEPGPTGSFYYLYSYIENDLDQGNGVNINGFAGNEKCDAAMTTTNCRYYVGSSNASQLIPN